LTGRSADDSTKAVGEVDHLLRQAASKEAGEPVMTTAPDDDQIAQAILGY
jgi:hypothetical protein